MKKNLYIDDVNIGNYGIYISSDTYLNAPLIDYTEFQVPARDGNLILDNKRLNNVIRKFDCYIPENYDLEGGLNKLKKLIYSKRGYFKIVSDYDNSYYQYGYFAEELNVEPFITQSANFTLYFSCLPQKWYTETTKISKNVDTLRYSPRYRKSDDPVIQKLLATTKNNYDISNGWLLGATLSSGIFANTTYNINVTSTKNKQYIVIHYDVQNDTYNVIAEVDSYNLKFEYTPTTSGNIQFMIPVDYNDVDITATYNNMTAQFKEAWVTIDNTDLTNDDAFGSTPVLYFCNLAVPSALSGKGCIDVFSINGNIYELDLISLVNEYTTQGVIDNFGIPFAESYYIPIKIDLYNCKAYILDSFNYNYANAKIKYDISYLLKGNFHAIFGDEINIKVGCFWNSSEAEFIDNNLYLFNIQPNWWIL